MDLFTLINILLIIHLAGLIMGFVGGRAHGVVVGRIAAASPETAALLWTFEAQASRTAFIGTALLLASGVAMLWLKYDGLAGQGALFIVKMALVAAVTIAEIMRHRTALAWKAGNAAMERATRAWGKFSGLAAVATVAVAVFNFN
jgi:hypothetical protein